MLIFEGRVLHDLAAALTEIRLHQVTKLLLGLNVNMGPAAFADKTTAITWIGNYPSTSRTSIVGDDSAATATGFFSDAPFTGGTGQDHGLE